MNTIIKYFNLTDNYTLDELNKAYKYKIEILKNLDMNNLDKKILIKEYTKIYNLGIELLNKQLSIYPSNTYLNTDKHLTRLNNFFKFNSTLSLKNNDNFKNKFIYKSSRDSPVIFAYNKYTKLIYFFLIETDFKISLFI